MVLRTCLITIYEAPTTFSITALRLRAFCKSKMGASYSDVLFLHQKSKRLETKCFLFLGSIKTHLTVETSYVLDPSKYKAHKLSIQGPLVVLVLLTLLLLLFQSIVQVSFSPVWQGRRPNYVSGGVGISCARLHPSCVSRKKLQNKSSLKDNASFLPSKGVTLCLTYKLENT